MGEVFWVFWVAHGLHKEGGRRGVDDDMAVAVACIMYTLRASCSHYVRHSAYGGRSRRQESSGATTEKHPKNVAVRRNVAA